MSSVQKDGNRGLQQALLLVSVLQKDSSTHQCANAVEISLEHVHWLAAFKIEERTAAFLIQFSNQVIPFKLQQPFHCSDMK